MACDTLGSVTGDVYKRQTSRLSGFRQSMKSLPAASGSGSENRLL